ncbi:MAG TPA: hypothetical protein VM098_01135 [Phycisphaerae bacterium]|nr:hypothetical protein [Phycisphaerae bacterium]
MNRIQLIVIVGFALAFAAGGSVGMLIRPGRGQETEHHAGSRRNLAKELALTADQQAQMRKVWSEVTGGQVMRQLRERRMELSRQRTEGIEGLFTDEQRKQYDDILADHAREMEKIDQERHRLVQEAVERTKTILSEEQAKNYEEIRKSGRRGPSRSGEQTGRLWRGRRGRPRTRPAPEGSTSPPQP